MTAARHAADIRDEVQRLRLMLQTMCERSMLGIAPTSEEIHTAFLGAGNVEYCVSRTIVAIDCGARRGSDRDPPPAGDPRRRRTAYHAECER